MHFSEEFIDEVRSSNDIVDVISPYVTLKKKGGSYFGLCPFHSEKTGSFCVSRERQTYHCFGCGEGGNVFTFVQKVENLTFVEAVETLAQRAGIEVRREGESGRNSRDDELKKGILDANRDAALFFYGVLKSERGKKGLEYLKNRGLSDETIKQFGLGYSPLEKNALYTHLKNKGYNDLVLKESGLFTFEEKGVREKFWNRVMFPIMDKNNRVIAFGGRVMGDGHPKYLNSPETKVFDKSRSLYGINRARTSRKDYFLICEGYMDVIALHQAGFTNAVAALGTSFTSGHASLIKRYVKKVVLTFDSDDAGKKAAMRAIPILREAVDSIRVLNMEPYKDPDEFIKALGADEFEKRINDAENFFMFEMHYIRAGYDADDPESFTAFCDRAAGMLAGFREEIERANYINAVSREFNIPSDMLKRTVEAKIISGTGVKTFTPDEARRPERSAAAGKRKQSPIAGACGILFTLIADSPGTAKKVSRHLSADDFTDPFYEKIARMVFEGAENGYVDQAKIISAFTDEDDEAAAAACFNADFLSDLNLREKEKALNDAVIKIKKEKIDFDSKKADKNDAAENARLIKERYGLQKIKIIITQ